jgi:hypothetical protein
VAHSRGGSVADLDDLLARQAGVLTRAQARSCGCPDSRIRAHLGASRWQRVLPRVYCTTTGHLSRLQQLWAALLYAGDGAALSHWTAAELYGTVERSLVIHVTVSADRQVRSVPGVRIHRASSLDSSQIHPVLTPRRTRVERTVLDLLDTASTTDRAFGLVANACQRRLTTPERLAAALASRPRTRWRATLGPALVEIAAGSHSLLEHKFMVLAGRHGLPKAERQLRWSLDRVHRWLDCDFGAIPVRVELDGRLGHERLLERWRDMDRDNAAALEDRTVLRYGWADVTSRACEVAGQVASALVLRGWTGVPRVCGNECALEQPSVTTNRRAVV